METRTKQKIMKKEMMLQKLRAYFPIRKQEEEDYINMGGNRFAVGSKNLK